MRPTPPARWLIACVLAALPLAGATVAQVPKASAVPKPMPAAVVKAWSDAGAEAVWVRVGVYGVQKELTTLANLTALGLSYTPVTDAGLKELAAL